MAHNRGFLKRRLTKGNAKGNGNTDIDCVEVTRVAYELYEQRGREDGHALDDWLKAEGLVRQQQRQASQIIV